MNNADIRDQHLQQAIRYTEQGDYLKAVYEYEEMIRINPDDAWAHLFLSGLLKYDRPDTASELCRIAIKLADNDADLLWVAGDLYEDIGNFHEAIKAFEKSLSIKPDLNGYVYLGELLEEQGEREKALNYYLVASNIDPSDVKVKSYLAK